MRILISVTVTVVVASCGSSKRVTARGDYETGRPGKETPAMTGPESLDVEGMSELAAELVREARTWLGTPYRYGGQEKQGGADCSGFVMEVFRVVTGILLPRNSGKQREFCTPVDKSELRVGDLVFFASPSSGGGVAHVGMYIGDGVMIHASSSRGVTETPITGNYYVKHYLSSGRVADLTRFGQ